MFKIKKLLAYLQTAGLLLGVRRTVASAPVNENVRSLQEVDLDAFVFPAVKDVAYALAGPQTLAAGQMSGAALVVIRSSNAAPGTVTTRTAAQIISDITGINPGAANDFLSSWVVRVVNTGAGTWTWAAGSGVTINGTGTIATNVWRDYLVTVSTTGAIVMQSMGSGVSP